MLFHNVYEMSSNSTPTRHGRGMPVPGIDTRGPVERTAASLSFNGWPLTPPSSAHDSRRPSLAYSALSDASNSGPSSVNGYSQPATPVHGMNQPNDFTQQWSDGVHASLSGSLMDATCGATSLPASTFGSFPNPVSSGASISGLPAYPSAGHGNFDSYAMDIGSVSPMRETWAHQQQAPHGQSGLRATLFQSQDPSTSSSLFNQPASSVQTTLGASAFPNYDTAAPTLNTNVYQTPQLVVPSQVSPHDDYPMEGYSSYGNRQVEDGFTQSFDSSATGYSGWEELEPPSPHDAYFGQSDEDDCVMVKHEVPNSPTKGSPNARGFFERGPSRSTRRKSSKRGRKSQSESKCWFSADVHNMEIRCSGNKFDVIHCSDGSVKYLPLVKKDSKPHKCRFEEEDGRVCIGEFERSEHLKRHMSKHSKERPYPCPLHGKCSKAISRPDNAADHFRTHLRAPTKGKRNKHCTFKELEEAIIAEYAEKTATKLLNNLRKWVFTENERLLMAGKANELIQLE